MQKDITTKKLFLGTLYLRISTAFLVMLALVGLAYVFITTSTSGIYFQHVNQRLNRNAATNIVSHSDLFKNGKVDDTSLAEIFHDVMVINPSLEVYLLDTGGKILSFYAPGKKIALRHISLPP
ncbi:MAG TPA: hypothetical protein VFO37_11725, partial [Chitinophagaceae bacterium]|nr:hypothetical protein [Chitinophagaceae bacterium]